MLNILRVLRARRPDTSSLKPKAGAAPKKGMQLGKARKANDFLDSLRAEGEVIQVSRWPGALACNSLSCAWLGSAALRRQNA